MFSIMALIICSEGDKIAIASPVISSKKFHPRRQLWAIIENMILKATFFGTPCFCLFPGFVHSCC